MDGTARLWDVPRELEDDPERLGLWVQVTSGRELNGDGSVRWLEAAALRERRSHLQRRGGAP
jgi:hypothetical protein